VVKWLDLSTPQLHHLRLLLVFRCFSGSPTTRGNSTTSPLHDFFKFRITLLVNTKSSSSFTPESMMMLLDPSHTFAPL
jgi:hypothetical protein